MKRGRLRETSVRIDGVLEGIRTEHFPNTRIERYSYTNLLSGKMYGNVKASRSISSSSSSSSDDGDGEDESDEKRISGTL
jgi:hypothetical protein